MPRAFTSADIIQSTPGTAALSTGPTVSLPSQVTAGRRGGIIIMGAAINLDKPQQWHFAASAGSGLAEPKPAPLAIMCRADLPSGEQSWAFAAFGGVQTNWTWVVEEWANLSFAPLAAASSFTAATASSFEQASISTGTTGAWDASQYVVGIAAVLLMNSTAGGSVWPSVSWSNGFTETDVLSIGHSSANGPAGSGPNTNDLQLRVARRYGTAGETGGWETTATFTGAMTFKNESACLAIFRAENYAGDI